MSGISKVLDEILQKHEDSPKTIAALAEEIGISAAQISRIKSGKSSLTQNVIDLIVNKFEPDVEQRHIWQERFKRAQLESALGISQSETHENPLAKYAITEISRLFERLTQKHALLLVDYRDLPQAVSSGAFPDLIEKTIAALKSGLNLALFQPFGDRRALHERHNVLSEKALNIEDPILYETANQFVSSYFYLTNLANKVREFYWSVKKELSSVETGQIVLYEAAYKKGNKFSGVIPSLTASGVQSRLFYANFLELDRYQTRVYEWVSAPENEHFFIERSKLSLNADAVRMQFNPIPAYWSENKKLPENKKELDAAYERFGIHKLFGEEEVIKWEVWTRQEKTSS